MRSSVQHRTPRAARLRDLELLPRRGGPRARPRVGPVRTHARQRGLQVLRGLRYCGLCSDVVWRVRTWCGVFSMASRSFVACVVGDVGRCLGCFGKCSWRLVRVLLALRGGPGSHAGESTCRFHSRFREKDTGEASSAVNSSLPMKIFPKSINFVKSCQF